MTKEDFISQLERATLVLKDLPVSSAMAAAMAAELKKGEPSWWVETRKAWDSRRFVAWSEAWALFLTCVHFETLSDAEGPLVPYFPSCGGTDEVDPSGAFAKFLAKPPASFFKNLGLGARRSFVPLRAPLWIAPAALFFQVRDQPFHIVEVNAGAGLNLLADTISKPPAFDSELVAARIGLDQKPLDLDDIAQRRWLTAGIMPENLDAIEALDRAIDVLIAKRREDPNHIQLAACPAESAPRFIAKNIPPDDPEVGLLLLNMATTSRMSDEEYQAYSGSIAELMKSWGGRCLWVEVENVRGELYSNTYQVRVHRLMEGQVRSLVLASIDLEARKADYAKESESFLAAGAPKRKKIYSPLQFPSF